MTSAGGPDSATLMFTMNTAPALTPANLSVTLECVQLSYDTAWRLVETDATRRAVGCVMQTVWVNYHNPIEMAVRVNHPPEVADRALRVLTEVLHATGKTWTAQCAVEAGEADDDVYVSVQEIVRRELTALTSSHALPLPFQAARDAELYDRLTTAMGSDYNTVPLVPPVPRHKVTQWADTIKTVAMLGVAGDVGPDGGIAWRADRVQALAVAAVGDLMFRVTRDGVHARPDPTW